MPEHPGAAKHHDLRYPYEATSVRAHRMYSGKPSSIVTAGSNPNAFLVALMSARLSRMSPARGGPCRTTGFSPLVARWWPSAVPQDHLY